MKRSLKEEMRLLDSEYGGICRESVKKEFKFKIGVLQSSQKQ